MKTRKILLVVSLFLFILFLIVLSAPLANPQVEDIGKITKEYFAEDKRMIIYDSKDIILDIKLLTPHNLLVGAEEDALVAEFYLENYSKDINIIFDSIGSYDTKENYELKDKEYWFKWGIDYVVEECHNISEFEPDIKEDFVFCQNVTETNWTRFGDLNELPSKSIKIGMFTNTRADLERGVTKVEWVGNIKGISVSEWAEYEIVGLATFTDSDGDYSIDQIYALAITSDDNYLITSSFVDDYVSIMNITDKTAIVPLATFTDSAGDYSVDGIYALAVTSDGNYLITSSNTDNYTSIMNITDKTAITPLATYTASDGDYSIGWIRALTVTSDGNYLITSSYADDYVSVMNITDKTAIVPLATFTDSAGDYSVDGIFALTVTSDGNYLITSSFVDDYVSIMNITDKTAIVGLATYTDSLGAYSIDGIYALAITSDDNYLITSSNTDDYVSIMNITDKTAIVGLATFTDSAGDYSVDGIYALAVTSDGNYLITSSYNDDYVSIMNITDKTAILPLASYYDTANDYSVDGIFALTVTSDGNYLITSSFADDYVSIMKFQEVIDITAPTFSSTQSNTTIANTAVNFSTVISDETALSGYIFETNNTGTFVNYTWIALSSGGTAYNITTLNSTVGAVVNYSFYANDTSNNWARVTAQVTITSAAQSYSRNVSDALTCADYDTRETSVYKKTYDELAASHSEQRVYGGERSAADALISAESNMRTSAASRSLSDAFTSAVSNSYIIYAVRYAADALTSAVSSSRTWSALKYAHDAFTSVASIRTASLFLRHAYDALTGSVSSSMSAAFLRHVHGALTTAVTSSRTWSSLRYVYDALASADFASASREFIKYVYDSLTAAVSDSRVVGFLRSVHTVITTADFVDFVFTGAMDYFRYVHDTVSASISNSRIVFSLRAACDAIASGDAVPMTADFIRRAYDAVATAVSSSRSFALLRGVYDAVAASDFVSTTLSFVRRAYDALSTSVAASMTRGVVRRVYDAIVTADFGTWAGSIVRTVYDALTTSAASSKTVGFLRNVFEAITASDARAATISIILRVYDSISSSVSSSRTVGFVRYLYDSIATAVSNFHQAFGISHIRYVYDTISSSVSSSRTARTIRTVYDILTSSDGIMKLIAPIVPYVRGLLATRGYYYPTPYWLIPFAFIAVLAFAPAKEIKEVKL